MDSNAEKSFLSGYKTGSGVAAHHRFDNAKRRRPDNHARQAMLTPGYVLEPIRELLGGIGLDPCTEPENPTGAILWYHLPQDGCCLPWDAESVFCNPPYGEARNRWVERCIAEGEKRPVVLLIPSHTETKIFQRALVACDSVLFVRARLRFGVLRENRRQEAASHGSAIFGFGIGLMPLAALGVVMQRAGADAAYRHSENELPRRPLRLEANNRGGSLASQPDSVVCSAWLDALAANTQNK